MSNKKLEEEIKKLKIENKKLKKILKIAKAWMEREVKANVIKIAKNKLKRLTCETKNNFFGNNVEDMISQKISDFFGEIMLLNIPSSVVDNIISAEINYFHLRENPISDGLSVVSSYHKALDILVEQNITKGFRKFCKKKGYDVLRKNDLIEKSLNSVVNRGFILSIGRLYHLLKLIKNDGELYDYGKAFEKYLDKYTYLKDILLSESFYNYLGNLVNSNILGSKRHKGKIDFEETKKAREGIIGDFKDKDSLIYKLVETQNIDL